VNGLRAAWKAAVAGLVLAVVASTQARAQLQEEVPFITTPDAVTLAMLELAQVGAADHVIDLGSGDGRIVITAAKRFGASGLGVEIVPDLVQRSRTNSQRAGVAARTEFREQDLFATELGRASVITMYLLPDVNLQLRPRLLALAPGTRIVSHDWDLGDWTPDRTLTIEVPDKPIGREKLSRVHLWTVPAQVQGRWCEGAYRIELVQRFQAVSAVITRPGPGPALVFDGRLQGRELRGQGLASGWQLVLQGDTLRVQQAGSTGLAGRAFRRDC
jgi:hypothetical protein